MLDYARELENRVKWIQSQINNSGAKGIVYGNSGGKDSVLVAILCKKAADNVLGVIMPCGSKINYGKDRDDALIVAKKFGIETICVDLSETKTKISEAIEQGSDTKISEASSNNMNPRLRMTTLYSIAQTKGYLVAGTGNRSEVYMGYFTKWGDGGFDFNPIADLTVTEIYEFLRFLDAPLEVIEKAPSAGLYDGQTDEKDMGVSYTAIDKFITTGEGEPQDIEKIKNAHAKTEHKRGTFNSYDENQIK